MPNRLITRVWEEHRPFRLSARTRRIVLVVLFGVCYVLAFGYHVALWSAQQLPSPFLEATYNVVVAGGYVALWYLLSQVFHRRQAAPSRVFWTTLLVGLLFIGAAWFIARVGRLPDQENVPSAVGFDYATGAPLALATVIKMNVLSLLEATFAFVLLQRLRDLVLFKRTRSSQRNWFLMLGFSALAALAAFMKSPQSDLGPLVGIAMVPAVVLMVVNSFRLSWILYLTFREKMAAMGLSFLLFTMLAVGLAIGGDGLLPGAAAYMKAYSYPLYVFSILATVFGILYCVTAFLSLLFHLPTTSDFQRKADEMAAMHSLTHLVSQVFDFDKLTSTIAASPVDAGSGHAAWLALADPRSGTLRPRIVAAHAIDIERVRALVDTEALYAELHQTREAMLLEEAPTDHRIEARPGDHIGSLLAVPLTARDDVLGALFVAKEVMHGFEKDDIEAISVFAAQAALALDNARLFEEKVEKERLTRELDIAREVQRKLLPQKVPSMPGLTVAAASIPAQEVGGDYYDFVRLDEHRLAVIIADVSGKGTSAAFYMAEMQGIFRSISRLSPEPVDFLTHANEALNGSLEKNVFITVNYGVVDLQNEEFVLARAGHSPAAVIDLNGSARFVRTRGLGLGLDRSGLFCKTLDVERIRLQPGDVFALYTDGVIESRNAQGEEYGYDRLLEALKRHRHEDAPDLHAAILDHLDDFLGTAHYGDDLTLLVLKWHGIDLPGAAASPQASSESTKTPTLGS